MAGDIHRGVVVVERCREHMIVCSRCRSERAERDGGRGARVVSLVRREGVCAGGRLRDYYVMSM